ncbi:MAG: IS30 family transposase [Nitrospira sp.]|nr:IS30 family transposase [Nitrospira sp.]
MLSAKACSRSSRNCLGPQLKPRTTVRRLKPFRQHVHTITYDNGKEFAGHRNTAQCLQTHVFFATPYHAWERGVNENTNGLIRD